MACAKQHSSPVRAKDCGFVEPGRNSENLCPSIPYPASKSIHERGRGSRESLAMVVRGARPKTSPLVSTRPLQNTPVAAPRRSQACFVNLPILICWGTPRIPPVPRQCTASYWHRSGARAMSPVLETARRNEGVRRHVAPGGRRQQYRGQGKSPAIRGIVKRGEV
jgi:hypothetical protein